MDGPLRSIPDPVAVQIACFDAKRSMYNVLQERLAARCAADNPIRVGLIGAGKFGVGLAVQLAGMDGIELAAVADLDLARARHAYAAAGAAADDVRTADSAAAAERAVARRRPCISPDGLAVAACAPVEIVVEATGSPEAGAVMADAAIAHGKHVVMANVEADVTVGALLRRKADRAGVVYTLVDGDQPGAIMNLVRWARLLGFEIVAAGRGTVMRPDDRAGTPDTVPERFGFAPDLMARRTINPRMYNSFRDGTKAQIEMAAVANMTGLVPDVRGMHEPAVNLQDIPRVFSLQEEGGLLARRGVVELANSVAQDGISLLPQALKMGVFVVIRTAHPYIREDLQEYMGFSGGRGDSFLLYRPYHLVAVTAPLSLLRAALLREPTGQPALQPCAEVVAAAKKDLPAGAVLDGGGGYAVVGLADTAARARAANLLPLGLCSGAELTVPVRAGDVIRRDMVSLTAATPVHRLRREQDRQLAAAS